MNLVLSDNTFKGLRDYIYELTGIYINDTKKYFIENRLQNRIKECRKDNFDDYLSYIKSPSGSGELINLYNAITTNETYFFREQEQLYVCVQNIISQLKQKKTRIKIWSAACSTGEEIYTIAILLLESGISSIELIASDISLAALESAKRGIYNSYSIRNVPTSLLQKYFKKIDNQFYQICDQIKKMVAFHHINLIKSSETRKICNVDILFCRNVLIYFDDKAKQRAIANLYDSLAMGGFLFLSLSESLHNVTRAFKPFIINRVVTYQKL